MIRQEIPAYCGQCVSRCGCKYIVDGGIFLSVEPNPEHPTGKGVCAKGRSAPDIVNSPDRLLHPMKRTRPKGGPDPGWQRISWDEALELTSKKLRHIAEKRGPESVAFTVTTRSGTSILDSFSWILRLCRAFGSPNAVLATENCNWHKDFATALTFGAGTGMPEFENTGCLILWGFNPSTSWLSFAAAATESKKRGAKLIIADPRRAGLAKMADEWLRLRPGSDGALALGIAGVMMQNGWYDQEFVSKWTNGPFLVRDDNGYFLTEADIREEGSPVRFVAWDETAKGPVILDPLSGSYAAKFQTLALFGEFKMETTAGQVGCRPAVAIYADLCRNYSPEKVEKITGVSADLIVRTARLLHENRPVSYFTWTGVGQQSNATQTTRAINLLYALTGSLDGPGGNVYYGKPPINDVSGIELLSKEQRLKTLGLSEHPIGPPLNGWVPGRSLYKAILDGDPYPVTGMVGFGQNLLLTQPDTEACKKALGKLEFYVHCDLFLNQTATYADIVLPVASPWERQGLCSGFQINRRAEAQIQLRKAATAPRGESKSDTWIVFELAKRLGLSDLFFDGDIDAGLRYVLKPSGATLDELRRKPEGIELPLETRYRKFEKEGFATPTGRLEIYSLRLLEIGQSPLPEFAEPSMSHAKRPDLKDRFPLVLTSAKIAPFCHSQHRSIPKLRKSMPDPVVYLHHDAAAKRGIADDDWVLVMSPKGTLRARAVLDGSLLPYVVFSQYGWWQSSESGSFEGDANYSNLIDMEDCDPVSGSASLRSCICDIRKAPGPGGDRTRQIT